MPTWTALALLFPAFMGVVNVLDKYIIERYAPSIYLYAFWTGAFELVIGTSILVGVSADGLDASTVPGAALSGVLRAASFLLLLGGLKRGQVARIMPIWYSHPLMVALLATLFLDESLSALLWGSIVLVVIGVGLVSWHGGRGGGEGGGLYAVLLTLSGALVFAVAIVVSKSYLEEGDFWEFYAVSRVTFAFGLVSVVGLPHVRRGALAAAKIHGFLKYVAFVEVMITASIVTYVGAVALGPVARVAAFSALQPSVILLYSLVLASRFQPRFGHWIARSTIKPQLAGIAVITTGVVFVTAA